MKEIRSNFVYNGAPGRVVFGTGVLPEVAAEVGRLNKRRALVLCTPQQVPLAEKVRALLGDWACGLFDQATMHTPVEVTQRALDLAVKLSADCLIAVGGGSTTGLGKAVAARTDLTQIVIPTTYAGSEMTSILGETADGLKTTRRGPEILPEVVIYDVALSASLSKIPSATSGMNAIAHAVEALYARNGNPIVSLMACDSIRSLALALPRIVADPYDMVARYDALYGAWLGGTCLGAVDMAFHHKICHTLGGTFNLPHAETHAVMLPYSTSYVAEAVPTAMSRISEVLGQKSDNAAVMLFELGRSIGVPASLASIGMPYDGLDTAADLAVKNPYWNPIPIERPAIRALLECAYVGAAPSR